MAVHFLYSDIVTAALKAGQPVVALESAVISHGLPYPESLQLAKDMEAEIRDAQAVPATILLRGGQVKIGASRTDLEDLATADQARKISIRDIAAGLVTSAIGGTTVAATAFVAHQAGIRVFATGGIGGVHRGAGMDISADLPVLARTPIIVVCAGAKSILDLPATLEYLETEGVPLVGYQTDEFPAFYARESGLPVSLRLDGPQQLVDFARTHWEIGLQSAILVTVPPPAHSALKAEVVERAVDQAVEEARAAQVSGAQTTPFLLSRVSELTGRTSIQSNLDLLRNNARVAAEIASAFSGRQVHRV